MFTLDEIKQDPAVLIDLKEDVSEECELLGGVSSIVLYDVSMLWSITPSDESTDINSRISQLEEEGIITVKFTDVLAAQACCLVRVFSLSPHPPSIHPSSSDTS